MQTNSILALFDAPSTNNQPVVAVIRAQESILDFAARTTGSYTNWQSIVASNNLMPPYTGTTPAPGIATPGQKLFLPPFSINSAIPATQSQVLGTDIEIGFPYTEMPPWNGDFTLVTGINNYEEALSRRVLTTLGTLIYHTNYGSLIPPEAGNVSTSSEAFLLSSYLKSALLSDPRTQSINQITAYSNTFGQIVMTATVTPYSNIVPIPFNLVIVPQNSSGTSTSR